MIKLFRASLVVSVIAVMAAIAIPLDQPLHVSFSIERPPVELLVMSICILVSLPMLPIAVYGLLRFRRWGRVVAAVVTVPLIGLLLLMGTNAGIGSVVSTSAKVAAAAAGVAWVLTVLLAYTSGVRGRFRRG